MLSAKQINHDLELESLRNSAGRIPVIRKHFFVLGGLAFVILYGFLFLPPVGVLSLLDKLSLGFFVLLLISWIIMFVSDELKPEYLKMISAFSLIAVIVLLYGAYVATDRGEMIYLFFNSAVIKKSWPYLVKGFWTTIYLAIAVALLSTALGLIVAIFRSFNNWVLNFFLSIYVDFFRAIPIIVLLMLIYYGLPFLNIRLSAIASGIIGLGLNSSAYVSEIFRAGFKAVKSGQIEAARALGMTTGQTIRLVILPQAVKVVIPPLVGNYVSSAKDTALCSSISIIELLKAGTSQQAVYTNPSPLIFVTVLYLVLFVPLTRFSGFIEMKMKSRQRVSTI